MSSREETQMPFWRMFIFIFAIFAALLGLGFSVTYLVWHAWTGEDGERLFLLGIYLALTFLLSGTASVLIYRAELKRIRERRSSGKSGNDTPPT